MPSESGVKNSLLPVLKKKPCRKQEFILNKKKFLEFLELFNRHTTLKGMYQRINEQPWIL